MTRATKETDVIKLHQTDVLIRWAPWAYFQCRIWVGKSTSDFLFIFLCAEMIHLIFLLNINSKPKTRLFGQHTQYQHSRTSLGHYRVYLFVSISLSAWVYLSWHVTFSRTIMVPHKYQMRGTLMTIIHLQVMFHCSSPQRLLYENILGLGFRFKTMLFGQQTQYQHTKYKQMVLFHYNRTSLGHRVYTYLCMSLSARDMNAHPVTSTSIVLIPQFLSYQYQCSARTTQMPNTRHPPRQSFIH